MAHSRSPGAEEAGRGPHGPDAPPDTRGGIDQSLVRVIMARLPGQLEAIALRMVERYREEIIDYKLADHDFLYRDVYGVSLAGLRVAVANLESGRAPALEEFEVVRSGAARRVHEFVSLESFLHAVRLWGLVLWQSVLACTHQEIASEREAALALVAPILEHIDLLSVAAARGYVDELQAVWSDREVVRHDLVEALIAGDGDSERVRRLARSLRVRLSQSYLVVVARTDEPPTEEMPDQSLANRAALRSVIEAARTRLRPRAGSLLVGMRHGAVMALYPFEHATEVEVALEACSALARDLGEAGVSVGVSGCHRGLGSLGVSYSEAVEAVEIAVATGARGRLVAFDEVLVDSIVRSSRHAERILDDTVTPLLAYDSDHRSDLVATLRAFVASGFNLTKSAESLSVHPNTVVYRLRRIREITGRDPHTPDDLLLLHLGLKLIDLTPERARASGDDS